MYGYTALGICLIVITAVIYLALPVYRAIGRSYELQQNAVAYQQHPHDPTMRILVAGDSTAYGLGARRPEDSIAGRIGTKYPNAELTNIGVVGLKLQGLREKLSEPTLGTYDFIVLQIGANDVTGFTPATQIRRELKAVLDRAHQLTEKVIVLTAGNIGASPVFRAPLRTILTKRTRVVRSIFIDEVSKYPSATYIDLFEEPEHDPFTQHIALYYAFDRFHPSGEGYGLWYQSLQSFLPPTVGSN